MKIRWYGQSCFLLTSETGTKIITDPYTNMLKYRLPKALTTDIVSVSHQHRDHNNVAAVNGNYQLVNKAGNYKTCDIEIRGIQTFHDKVSGAKKGENIIFCFQIDGLNVCHCGDLGHILSDAQIEKIGNVDILLIPVGGGFTIGPDDASQVVKQLKPKVIIPMHYRTKALGVLGLIFRSVEEFITVLKMKSQKYQELEVNKSNIESFSGIAVIDYF